MLATARRLARLAESVGAKFVLALFYHFFRGSSTWSQLDSLPLDALGYVQSTMLCLRPAMM